MLGSLFPASLSCWELSMGIPSLVSNDKCGFEKIDVELLLLIIEMNFGSLCHIPSSSIIPDILTQ